MPYLMGIAGSLVLLGIIVFIGIWSWVLCRDWSDESNLSARNDERIENE